jgi:hypothetical protein
VCAAAVVAVRSHFQELAKAGCVLARPHHHDAFIAYVRCEGPRAIRLETDVNVRTEARVSPDDRGCFSTILPLPVRPHPYIHLRPPRVTAALPHSCVFRI